MVGKFLDDTLPAPGYTRSFLIVGFLLDKFSASQPTNYSWPEVKSMPIFLCYNKPSNASKLDVRGWSKLRQVFVAMRKF